MSPLVARRHARRVRVFQPSTGLKRALDGLYADFNHEASATDPIHLVRRYARPEDREIVGFCSAALAFGRVASVLTSIDKLLSVLGPRPAEFVRRFDPARERRLLEPLGHRWIRSADLVALLWILKCMLIEDGSIERFFLRGYDADQRDVGPALDSFSARACAIDVRPACGRVPTTPGVRYFFPQPAAGSPCKRLNLFLRWMVRRDAIDLGVWRQVRPTQLIVPLDTHVIRVGQCLGLTAARTPGWKMAADITTSLRAIDPEDPVKYDFALCHLGISGACGFNRPQGDRGCPLRAYCRPEKPARRRSRTE
ncbi:MAG: TIGR02757 family protein [Acidobacteria bacterium]|nr:TIGR02757 family protein [Acidobacteriota bacterium]